MKQWKRKLSSCGVDGILPASAQKRQARSKLSPLAEQTIRDNVRSAAQEKVLAAGDGTTNEWNDTVENVSIYSGRATSDFLADIDEQRRIGEVDIRVQDQIYERCESELADSNMSEDVCSVCDCFHPRKCVVEKVIGRCPALMESMRRRLKVPLDLPRALLEFYDCADISPALGNIMLSRDGIHATSDGVKMNLCRPCLTSLSNKKLTKPPKFAIANGFYIGRLPSNFEDTTPTEHAMLNLTQPTRFLAVVRGGRHSVIRSHAYLFRATPGPPASMLPREVVSDGSFRVTMVGAMTPAQKISVLKKYEARPARLREQLRWYTQNNKLYDNIESCASTDTSLPTRVVLDKAVVDTSASSEDGGDTDESSCETAPLNTGHAESDQEQMTSQQTAEALDAALARFNVPVTADEDVTPSDELLMHVASGIVTSHTPEDQDEAIQRVLVRRDVVVYRSNAILSDFDARFWAMSFCELFPYGRGGLDEDRPVKVGLEEFIRYCLRLSSRLHARHHSFMAVGFDVCARHRAFNAVYVRAKLSPALANSAAKTDRGALLAECRYKQARLEAIKASCPPPPPPPFNQSVHDLYSGISTGMRSYWGSNEEKAESRTNLLSMSLFLGQPAIFFTISPCSATSLRIGCLSGEIQPSVLAAIESGLNEEFRVTKALLGNIATSNPTVCAKYFDRLMQIFIDAVLNWDQEGQCSRNGGGIFGFTKGFFASVESQNSTGDLHCHMLVWVHGLPTTVEEYYALLRDVTFRDRLKAYVKSIATASAPITQRDTCPVCGDESLKAKELRQTDYQRPAKNSTRPVTAECSSCNTSFGGGELLESQIAQALAGDGGNLTFDDRVFEMVASPKPLSRPRSGDGMGAVVLTKALLLFQHHRWSHSISCFKKSKRTPTGKVCRMFFPKPVVPETRWSIHDTIELERTIGNEYMNGYSPLLAEVFKTNHDVKFLAAGEGLEKAFYAIKYTTKDQNAVENLAAIHTHAFDKAAGADIDHNDRFRVGTHHIRSMLCSLTNTQEVAAPMAALYLQRGSAVYASHEFVKLYLVSIMASLFKDDPVDVVLTGESGGLQASSQYLDYLHRPSSLVDVSLMQYIKKWEKRRSLKGSRFHSDHPQAATHSVFERKNSIIVTVIHSRLPDITSPDTPLEVKEKYWAIC